MFKGKYVDKRKNEYVGEYFTLCYLTSSLSSSTLFFPPDMLSVWILVTDSIVSSHSNTVLGKWSETWYCPTGGPSTEIDCASV